VRVYRRVQRAGPSGAVTQFDRIYVTEQRTVRQTAITPSTGPPAPSSGDSRPPTATMVNFDCDMFNDHEETGLSSNVHPGGYCFVYVSTANSGAVNEQKSICLPMFSNQPGQYTQLWEILIKISERWRIRAKCTSRAHESLDSCSHWDERIPVCSFLQPKRSTQDLVTKNCWLAV
jgi:hypothetical protein